VRERTQSLQDATIAAEEAHHARGELLARVNHDLLRPMTEIVELAAPLEQVGGKPAEYGAVIRRSATHLLGLIDDLIDQASHDGTVDEIRSELVDTQTLLAGLAFEAEGLVLAGGNEFVFNPAPDLPPCIRVDSRRLRQVLINLLDNAAKFTRGGRVEFQIDADPGPAQATLVFTVRDTGPGMNASQLAVVFEPYRRADEAAGFPGLGLGLAIARHWAERMGGEIVADSVPGQGTTMWVLLPVSLPELAQAPESKAPDGPVPTDGPDGLPASSGMAFPAPELLAEAAALLRLGAVSDLEDWAAGLQDSQPQHAAFACSVVELAERADLRGLALLLDRAASAGPVGAAGADRTAGQGVTP
jgi:K+-sensing histidine kinase KdpD